MEVIVVLRQSGVGGEGGCERALAQNGSQRREARPVLPRLTLTPLEPRPHPKLDPAYQY